MKIFEVDLNITGSIDERDITHKIKEKVRQQIEDAYDAFGITVEIQDIHNAEAFVKAYYEGKGYIAYKLEPTSRSALPSDLSDAMKPLNHFCREHQYEEVHYDMLRETGVPDFIMLKPYDNDVDVGDKWFYGVEDAFFVEVKSAYGWLSRTQAKWRLNHNDTLPVKVFWVDDNE